MLAKKLKSTFLIVIICRDCMKQEVQWARFGDLLEDTRQRESMSVIQYQVDESIYFSLVGVLVFSFNLYFYSPMKNGLMVSVEHVKIWAYPISIISFETWNHIAVVKSGIILQNMWVWKEKVIDAHSWCGITDILSTPTCVTAFMSWIQSEIKPYM